MRRLYRRYGFDEPYERLKALTRGNSLFATDVAAFVRSLGLPTDAEAGLLALTPARYVGLAAQLVTVGRGTAAR